MADTTFLKTVVVGDPGVGKTSLLLRWKDGSGLDSARPKKLEFETSVKSKEGQEFQLLCVDTRSTEDDARLRPLAYANPSPNVYLICFSYQNLASLESVPTWCKELTHHSITPTPFFLVGLAADAEKKAVTEDQVKTVLQHPQCKDKIEKTFSVSALNNEGIKELLEAVGKAAAEHHFGCQPVPPPAVVAPKNKKCTLF